MARAKPCLQQLLQYDLVLGIASGGSGFGLVSGAVVKTTLTLDLVLALQTMEEL